MLRTIKTVTFSVALVLAAICGLSATAGETISARIAEPVSINGQTFPAGLLQVTEIRDYSPGVTMNEVVIGGRSLGMLLAREQTGEATDHRSNLIFTRDAAGTLVLEGLAIGSGPVRQLMAFRTVDGHGQWYLRNHARPANPTLVTARK